MSQTSFQDLFKRARQSDAYWAERARLEFVAGLTRLSKTHQLSKSDIAKAIDTSPAYITKVFRADGNFTIESMVKLARAVKGQLRISIEQEAKEQHKWLRVVDVKPVTARRAFNVRNGEHFAVVKNVNEKNDDEHFALAA